MDKLKELAEMLYEQRVKEGWKNVSIENCIKRAEDFYRIKELIKNK